MRGLVVNCFQASVDILSWAPARAEVQTMRPYRLEITLEIQNSEEKRGEEQRREKTRREETIREERRREETDR